MFNVTARKTISIHALREEGDWKDHSEENGIEVFLSTPSARRATETGAVSITPINISIHALREEGDEIDGEKANAYYISIHALREEGDG